jgi:hypothetical protein
MKNNKEPEMGYLHLVEYIPRLSRVPEDVRARKRVLIVWAIRRASLTRQLIDGSCLRQFSSTDITWPGLWSGSH